MLSNSGIHTIEVTAFHSSGTGAYSLALAREAASTTLTCSTIEPGQVVSASLDVGDGSSRHRSSSRADCYTFSSEAGTRLTVAMDSSDFDTYLYLMDAGGEVIDSNDDDGTGTNSIATVTLPATGGYIVEATSWGADAQGSYTLSLTPETIPTPLVCSMIDLGQTVGGELDSNDGRSQNRPGAQADCYTFRSSSEDRIAVSLNSDEFDTYLYLLDTEGNVLGFDDDSGRGTHSRISGFEITASTIYTVEATSFGPGQTGSYTLSLTGVSLSDCNPIMIGDVIPGTLEIGDRESPHRSGSYADCHTFSGAAGDQIDISMSSADFDTYLFLLDPTGEVFSLRRRRGRRFQFQYPLVRIAGDWHVHYRSDVLQRWSHWNLQPRIDALRNRSMCVDRLWANPRENPCGGRRGFEESNGFASRLLHVFCHGGRPPDDLAQLGRVRHLRVPPECRWRGSGVPMTTAARGPVPRSSRSPHPRQARL